MFYICCYILYIAKWPEKKKKKKKNGKHEEHGRKPGFL